MNLLDIGLAFLEGLALIVSPCILPVLPLVLAASVDGGKRRPYGIIIGFVLAFSLFAVAARELVALLGLDLDVIRDVSLVLLALFGLVLLSEKLSERFSALTQGAANLGNDLASSKGEGLLSGIGIGALIGLVWTPCAGPILATVLVQVIRQQSDFAGNLVILSFGIGAGVPMLIIALTGRKLVQRLGFLTRHAATVRRGFGVLILVSVAWIASGANIDTLFMSSQRVEIARGELKLEHGLDKPYAAPEFVGIDKWLNSEPLTMAGLKGKVVLVDFWTYSCINCVRTLPYITAWDRKYREQGLVIVGVHAPEFEFEKKTANVQAAIAEHGIRYPVAQDNKLDTWSNFDNRYWPAHYLIDREGKVVYTHFGEGQYDVTENNIRYLLGLGEKVAQTSEALPTFAETQTPETYLGYARGRNFASPEEVASDASKRYSLPATLGEDHWALSGDWKIGLENSVSTSAGAKLKLDFNARKVFLVLGSASGKPIDVKIDLNGKPVASLAGKDAPSGKLTVDRNTLYELIDQREMQRGVLEVEAQQPGLEIYAFTFGA
ncbi:MAG: cytochrome c biogenesis protein DipZ [Gammaproteobacteria bacterium]|nr:cytochrome c biogenesis protein DipZ [Gammaproteobacteria bacterium]MBU1625336.1 cytochrome c biogenesis protein DipZ [Gammaproteobacteria bacterium]MBU1981596.1 cytochrome c biogenesis protein DipZ [Gammaproteobacteria bacterium]